MECTIAECSYRHHYNIITWARRRPKQYSMRAQYRKMASNMDNTDELGAAESRSPMTCHERACASRCYSPLAQARRYKAVYYSAGCFLLPHDYAPQPWPPAPEYHHTPYRHHDKNYLPYHAGRANTAPAEGHHSIRAEIMRRALHDDAPNAEQLRRRRLALPRGRHGLLSLPSAVNGLSAKYRQNAAG